MTWQFKTFVLNERIITGTSAFKQIYFFIFYTLKNMIIFFSIYYRDIIIPYITLKKV